ncbi:protein FAR1-RELATED SEQUENCE 5-like [Ricinus communis]|uniref:protein FAR1-RELATED SEQUENCE 5-like n=1 Tax=Ricinus communis TaxID=3988 RepID=UPI00201A6169|nr:protein FAR1-RELATED SEQUENCE 5-like [Ricinus communis]
MGGKQPQSVLKDGDKAIQSAISTVMSNSIHRLCSWHLTRNARQVSTKEFLTDFKRVMLSKLSKSEFEIEWFNLVNHYNLQDYAWMEDMYNRKNKWADAFFFGVSFVGMTTSQKCECMRAYLDHCLDTRLSLYEFVQQYFRALNRIRQNGMRLEYESRQSTIQLQTHLKGIKKSALAHYTNSVFLKVHDEIANETMLILLELKI